VAPEMESLYIQSRTLEAKDLEWIRQLIDAHPGWNRTKLSVHTAQRWQWLPSPSRWLKASSGGWNHSASYRPPLANLKFPLTTDYRQLTTDSRGEPINFPALTLPERPPPKELPFVQGDKLFSLEPWSSFSYR
jgi:hypothetical protein